MSVFSFRRSTLSQKNLRLEIGQQCFVFLQSLMQIRWAHRHNKVRSCGSACRCSCRGLHSPPLLSQSQRPDTQSYCFFFHAVRHIACNATSHVVVCMCRDLNHLEKSATLGKHIGRRWSDYDCIVKRFTHSTAAGSLSQVAMRLICGRISVPESVQRRRLFVQAGT